MLYSFDLKENIIKKEGFVDFGRLGKVEKELENLIANGLEEMFCEENQLMTIFQERPRQEEPDLCAIDKEGDLVMFELKRGEVKGDAIIQIMKYAQRWGRKPYEELNAYYNKYFKGNMEKSLQEDHREAFGLEKSLDYNSFNREQRLVLVGSDSDNELKEGVDYWKSKGINIDFIPYRVYEINEKYYLEFFSKPYDVHFNPYNRKGIVFDTNCSYDENAVWDMLSNKKISAYGAVKNVVQRFNKGDYVFYYHKGYGVIAVGEISDGKPKKCNVRDELYMEVKELYGPKTKDDIEKICISPSDLKRMLGKGFFFARTAKVPYLTIEECEILKEKLCERIKKLSPTND